MAPPTSISNFWARLALLLVLALPAIAVDQVTKALAREHLASRPPIEMLGGAARLVYAENPGVALSLGENLPEPLRSHLLTFGVGALLALVAGLALGRRDNTRGEIIALALVVGGGAGNLIDRIVNDGRVIDFAWLGVGPIHTAVFNVADMLILAGAIALVLLWNRSRKEPAPDAP